jgi:steroid delta-isomerase-like uncharacterized protein
MSGRSEANRAAARRWMEEVWNQRRTETIDELLPPHAVGHMEGGDVRGPEEFKRARAALLDAFPDVRVLVEDSVADGDHVVLRWRVTGTHRGAALGFPPTGRAVSFRGMTWMSFKNGVLVEGWDSWNQGALYQELQATSTPPRGTPLTS